MQAVLALPGADLLEQLVEGIFFPVVRGQDGDTAAPHKQGKGRLHKLRQIVHKGRLVDDDAPLFGTKGAGFGRQAPYIEAGGEADAVDGYVPVLVTQDDFLGLFRQHIERLGPEGAVTDEGLGHFLVVGKVKGILSPGFTAFGRFHDGLERLAVRGPDTTALFPDAHAGRVRHPATLVGQEDIGHAHLFPVIPSA